MAAPLRLSKIATTVYGKDGDPEVLVTVKAIDTPMESDDNVSEKGLSPWEVTLEKSEDPKTMAVWYKWATVLTISCGALCVTSASSMVSDTPHIRPRSDLMCSYPQAAFAEAGTMKEFGISRTVSILPISLFLMGTGVGPLLIGPLSEVYGASCDFHSSTEH